MRKKIIVKRTIVLILAIILSCQNNYGRNNIIKASLSFSGDTNTNLIAGGAEWTFSFNKLDSGLGNTYITNAICRQPNVDIPMILTSNNLNYLISGICDNVFKNNTTLETLRATEYVTILGDNVFLGATNLKSLTFSGKRSSFQIGNNVLPSSNVIIKTDDILVKNEFRGKYPNINIQGINQAVRKNIIVELPSEYQKKFYLGEELDKSDIKVYCVDENNQKYLISSDEWSSNWNQIKNSVGNKTFNIRHYCEEENLTFSTSININVEDFPVDIQVINNEEYTLSGNKPDITLNWVMKSGAISNINESEIIEISNYDTNILGSQTITCTCTNGDKTLTKDIEIIVKTTCSECGTIYSDEQCPKCELQSYKNQCNDIYNEILLKLEKKLEYENQIELLKNYIESQEEEYKQCTKEIEETTTFEIPISYNIVKNSFRDITNNIEKEYNNIIDIWDLSDEIKENLENLNNNLSDCNLDEIKIIYRDLENEKDSISNIDISANEYLLNCNNLKVELNNVLDVIKDYLKQARESKEQENNNEGNKPEDENKPSDKPDNENPEDEGNKPEDEEKPSDKPDNENPEDEENKPEDEEKPSDIIDNENPKDEGNKPEDEEKPSDIIDNENPEDEENKSEDEEKPSDIIDNENPEDEEQPNDISDSESINDTQNISQDSKLDNYIPNNISNNNQVISGSITTIENNNDEIKDVNNNNEQDNVNNNEYDKEVHILTQELKNVVYVNNNIFQKRDGFLYTTKYDGDNTIWEEELSLSANDIYEDFVYYELNIETNEIKEYTVENLVIDCEKPIVEIICNNKNVKLDNTSNNSKYSVYTNKNVKFNINIDFGLSGKSTVYYQMVKKNKNINDKKWVKLNNNNIVFNKNKKGFLYIKAQDNAGNISIVKTNGFVLDKTKPIVKNIKNNKLYKKQLTIKFSDNIKVTKAKLNNKKIKNNYKIKESGDYILKLYDKSGNIKKVKFSVDLNKK